MNEKCPYSDECGILASCDETCCRVKELFDDFYKVEKLYIEAKQENEVLKQQVEYFVNNYKLAHNRLKQLKTELHFKVEFIQEQREIINLQAEEIRIYKQCQGKRASKREEELKQENKNLEKEIKYLKEKCIEAGKELGKHSFTWDGKEKNLVIQAMELNEMYEKAEQKLEKIKEVLLN